MVRNDSAYYYAALYDACSGFEFSRKYYLSKFRLASHPSYGFSSLMAIPEFLMPGNFNNIWIGQTILSLIAIYCVYDILDKEFSDRTGAFFGGLVFGSCPVFLGLDSYFTLDFGCAVFAVYVLWAYYRQKSVVLFFSSMLLVFSKEFGIALLAGFWIGVMIYRIFFRLKGNVFTPVRNVFRDHRVTTLTVSCIFGGLCIFYYLFIASAGWFGVITEKESFEQGVGRGYIGWDAGYIIYKFWQCFCVNFSWLLLLMVILCLFKMLSNRQKKQVNGHCKFSKSMIELFTSGIAGIVLYFIFSCALVTYPLIRYHQPIYMIGTFLSFALFWNIFRKNRKLICAIASVIFLLFTAQSYMTIDPVMLAMYPHVETGSVPLITCHRQPDGVFTGDYVIYNYQYSFIDRCVRKALTEAGYDVDTDLIIIGQDGGLHLETNNRGWNSTDMNWAMLGTPGTDAVPIYYSINDPSLEKLRQQGVLKRKAVFLETPFNTWNKARVSDTDRSAVFTYYYNVKKHQISSPGGKITYYTGTLVP